jgi:hypothetical protein
MVKSKIIASCMLAITLLLSSVIAIASGDEPKRPIVDLNLDSNKEDVIQDLVTLSVDEAFNQLRSGDFLYNEAFLHKAIFTAFNYRKKNAIEYTINYFKLPVSEMVEGKMVMRGHDFYVAKKILHIFPEESTPMLLNLYETGNAMVKGNVILGLGNLEGQTVRDILVEALDDQTFCQERHDQMNGEPLRICDLAYNQLVLRCRIKKVLRTIANVHKIEIRDYHINILKGLL